ncbi:hypothetical protein [Haladaptatus cibarius]|uniref:hypothetical protein n=1 Tax=Haladaptatus cibarius TaxID=453847 RepID=UPI000679B722|nr:hypothetical protein [Haladaptatus cibarius]
MIDIIELVEGNLESMLNSGEIECPSDDCSNRRFYVNIWRSEEGSIIGDASCRDCDLQIELDLSDEPVDTAESTLEDLQNELHRHSPPAPKRKGLEAAE